MVLAAEAEGVFAADVERVAVDRRVAEGVAVPVHRLLGDLDHAGALDPGRRAEEVAVDELRGQPDGVEDLRAAVGLVGRDAHLGHHLEQPLADRLDVALDDFLGVDLVRHLAARMHVEHGVEGEVRVDGLGAVAGEAGEMVHLARLAGLDHEPDRGPKSLADKIVVHRRRREQRRDRDAVGADETIGQDDDVVAAMDGGFGAVAEAVERAVEGRRALLGWVGDVEGLRVEGVLDMADAADLLEILVGEDRLAHLETLAARGAFEVEDVRPRSDEGDEAHDELLADRVDRRVRHLSEVLLEVGVEELRPVRERRDRRVGAHRPDRLLARHGHRMHEKLEILLRVAEGLLAIEQRYVGARFPRLHRLQFLEHDLGAAEPILVRVTRGELLLDLVVRDDAALLQIDQQHLARLEAPLLDDLLLRDR